MHRVGRGWESLVPAWGLALHTVTKRWLVLSPTSLSWPRRPLMLAYPRIQPPPRPSLGPVPCPSPALFSRVLALSTRALTCAPAVHPGTHVCCFSSLLCILPCLSVCQNTDGPLLGPCHLVSTRVALLGCCLPAPTAPPDGNRVLGAWLPSRLRSSVAPTHTPGWRHLLWPLPQHSVQLGSGQMARVGSRRCHLAAWIKMAQ